MEKFSVIAGGLNSSAEKLANPTQPPDPPDMDDLIRRVGLLETDARDIRSTLSRLEPLIARIDERMKITATAADVAEIKGRLSQMPSTLQLILFVVAVLGIAGATRIFSQ